MLIGRREEWLGGLTEELRLDFSSLGYILPADIRVCLNMPAILPDGSNLTEKEVRDFLGLCFFQEQTCHVFIQTLCPAKQLSPVLVHELCHAALPGNPAHKGPFARLAHKLGLVGNLRYSTPGEKLQTRIRELETKVGRCPPLCNKKRYD